MAAEPRRLAQLPGYDTAPDVYETPELPGDATDDATTIGTGLSSPRPGGGKHAGPRNVLSDTSPDDFGSADDTDEEDEEDEDEEGVVSRRRLYPARARSRFGAAAAGIDARGTDLSDRVDGRRQGLRAAAARRRRRRRGGVAEDEESGEEGLAVRLARLRREAEECRVLAAKFKAEGKEEGKNAAEEDGKTGVEDDAEALNRLLASIEVPLASASRRGGLLRRRPPQPPGATAEDGAAAAVKASEHDTTTAPAPEGDDAQATATTLRQISAFDARLAALESALGVSSLDTPSGATTTTGSHATPAPLLPTLGLLDAQLATLASASSLARLDAAAARIQALKHDARVLHPSSPVAGSSGPAGGPTNAPMSPITEHARANGVTSRAESEYDDAAEALPTDDSPTASLSPADLRQLRALYALLPTLQSLSPTAPALIARLRSLRALHGAAVAAAGDLDAVSARQDALEAELASWKTGLEGVERAVREADLANGRNGTVVKGWVEGLEKRVEGLLGGK